jgi:hypothetical protein
MKRGNLRIYLGAAPGVGKTFAMLNEGWRRATRGTDVVIGIVETHGRKQTLDQIRDLEVIPRRTLEHRESVFEEMDVDAIIARRPRVVLVDELAHTNVPGSKHAKRYDDILEILDSGIDVISTVNIQHLESVNDVVEEITGVRQRETVPDEVVRSADQIELVDMSPEALRRRMAHGNIYPAEKVDTALGNYFREGNLSALRELALLWVADRVDDTLRDYRSPRPRRTWFGVLPGWRSDRGPNSSPFMFGPATASSRPNRPNWRRSDNSSAISAVSTTKSSATRSARHSSSSRGRRTRHRSSSARVDDRDGGRSPKVRSSTRSSATRDRSMST